MKTFKDREGREWLIDINIASIKRVNDLLDIDLLKLEGNELVERLIADPCTLCNVVYVLCMEQAKQRSISDEDFGRAMAGDAIDDATTAVLEEFVAFFPARKRPVMQQALARIKQIETAQLEAATRIVNSPEIDKLIAEAMNEAIGGTLFGAAPASSASTPASLTIRTLVNLAEARIDYDWNHTSAVLALVANCNRAPHTAPFHPRQFHPLHSQQKPKQASVAILKDVFIDGAF